ncbi:glycosyltransferase [Pseudoflavitalea sp. X16]|uniref:glycosyltransferase n=1 Tax=Paraflavitalea devenefica TaxID=2716334 RepID=UPI0014233B8E|nr:glycosyltransferase [Paraflavitalea devenefica]NII29547.1 glycosyltransferase [Paraflavitalea devenefica]
MSPRISTITICFNNLAELQTTCASVDKQTQLPYEHWIIDGSTTPDIQQWLTHTPQPPYRKWLCERDKGIADAFNKGVERASGDIINMLNSADHYYDEHTLSLVTTEFTGNPSVQWLHGKYQLERGGLWVTIGKPFDPGKLYRGMRSLSHQSMFIRRELHDKYGKYDTTLKNAMDYDLVCRISREPFVFLPQTMVVFAPGGTTYRNYLPSLAEARRVYERHFGFSWKLAGWQGRLKLLYYLLNSPIGKWLYKVKVWLKLENA